MKLGIIDYGAGNTQSVKYALDRIGCKSVLTDDPFVLEGVDGVIFPGVGHAAHAMKVLNEKGLVSLIKGLKQPVLGICLGMQLLCEITEEGNEQGIGIVKEKVKRFVLDIPVPHMGWNQVSHKEVSLFENIPNNAYFYFVHSYFVPFFKNAIGWTDYGATFTAAFQKDNFYACQFHPEKSGKAGEQLLKNFIKICE